ncbi:hypothetical protein [Oryza sativa Japonica Group]|uniref:Uncharacterized protein n=1 Tax=Oryza sativa subsp. japonica TaxID=39947 RepID=Q5VNX6_ORYSJ|nr:hypothetical protein [Oryza sativa Japonica Group]BAD68859.1 hypothetical protein [Oryza sativa Japonica Group]
MERGGERKRGGEGRGRRGAAGEHGGWEGPFGGDNDAGAGVVSDHTSRCMCRLANGTPRHNSASASTFLAVACTASPTRSPSTSPYPCRHRRRWTRQEGEVGGAAHRPSDDGGCPRRGPRGGGGGRLSHPENSKYINCCLNGISRIYFKSLEKKI